jgi:hypothetical protein
LRIYLDLCWLNPMAHATPDSVGGPLDPNWCRSAKGYVHIDTRVSFVTDDYSVSTSMLAQLARQ